MPLLDKTYRTLCFLSVPLTYPFLILFSPSSSRARRRSSSWVIYSRLSLISFSLSLASCVVFSSSLVVYLLSFLFPFSYLFLFFSVHWYVGVKSNFLGLCSRKSNFVCETLNILSFCAHRQTDEKLRTLQIDSPVL